MTVEPPKIPELWKNHQSIFPITACHLKRSDLKTLYMIIDEKQKEYRDRAIQKLSQLSNETVEDFEKRKAHVINAFVTSVTINDYKGGRLSGNEVSIFDSTAMPTRIKSVFYGTQSVPNAVLKHLPEDRISVFLDFAQPPLLDLSTLPTLPTSNESNFQIDAVNETWFSSIKSKLENFFEERKTSWNWLHRGGIYEILLFLVGLPFAVWACCKISIKYPGLNDLYILPRVVVYAYVLFVSLAIFRIMFSYTRWVFPKIETEGDRGHFKHRAVWGAIVLGVFGSAAWDLIKLIFA